MVGSKTGKKDIYAIESRTRERVSNTLSSVEVALAKCKRTEKKPARLRKKIRFLEKTNNSLSTWLKGSLLGKKNAASARERLVGFVRMMDELGLEGGKLNG